VIAFAAIAPYGDVDLAPELREAMTELDWGAEVPLKFVRTRRVVVIAPARPSCWPTPLRPITAWPWR